MLEMTERHRAPELQATFERQLNLCDLLEEIADSLPDRLDRQQCLTVARMIGPLIKQAHVAEEQFLFPDVISRHGDGDNVVEKLRLEHIEDECFAEELTDALLKLGSGDRVNMEAVGYMLRGFFEGIRRHIAFEREHLLQGVTSEELQAVGR